MISKISIIGGDLRIVKLVEMLTDEGAEVFTYGLEKSEISKDVKCGSLEEAVAKSNIILVMEWKLMHHLVIKKY